MNDTTLKDDLAYVRDLAEAGQSAPLLGGRFLAWWGGLVTLAYIGHYMIAAEIIGTGPVGFAYLWIAFAVIGVGGYLLLIKSMSGDKPGASSVGNRVEGNVWMIGGFALAANFITLAVKSAVTGEAAAEFSTSVPLVFSVYAIGLFTSGAIAGNQILKNAGYGALAMIALAIWFSGTNEVWAVAAIAAFLTVFIPGIFLLRQEPKSVV